MKNVMFITLTLLSFVFLHFVTCDYKSNQKRYYRSPLVLNKWSPIRQNGYRNPGLFVQLRPAGSNNIISRVPSPAYLKTDLSLRSRFNNSPIKTMVYQSSQKNINKNGKIQQHMMSGIRPNAFAFKENQQKNNNFIHLTRQNKPTKPVNTFVIAPITVMKPNEYIYENFNLQKFIKPLEQNESTEAIHTIEAPNLTLKSYEGDKLKLLKKERQVHQYQVREQNDDSTNINKIDQFAQSSIKFQQSDVSDNNVKESVPNNNDNHNLDAVTAPLVQLPENQYDDLNLPHLQQYLLEQKSILPNANSYNPSYLVMQSKNLLSKYQKHWDGQFKLENGYIDSPFKQESDQHFQPIVRKKPKHAVTIAEVYTTASPNIIRNIFENVPSVIRSSPTAAHLVDENPDYRTQNQNNMKLQEEQRQQQEEQNQIDAGTYHGHQLKNDLILKEAEENLQRKLYQQQQHEQSTMDLHQQAIMEQFKDSVMRIVVSDIESPAT